MCRRILIGRGLIPNIDLKNINNMQFSKCVAQWLSWLERRPVTAEVVGPSPTWVGCLRKGPDSEAVGRVGSDLVTSVASYSQ